ncbi:barren [Artomyces pyxidatus]|uniref:Barren n=1 Tax=Artomyces pyxidatus TaxID=48021 RepID=A0ACB8SYR4_9AGAM|nr:barren [Artomyces pyxidatus]
MATARTARAQRAQHSQPLYADDDTDTDTDQGTPRAPRAHSLRKRLSEVHDKSFAEDGARAPLKAVNINDDAAEKRRRRKSAKTPAAENAEAGPSSAGRTDGPTEEGSRHAHLRKQQPLRPVEAIETPEINIPIDIMSQNYEEWMKMAMDNKINSNNTWNFALIDYFHDMSLLRNNGDNSINFQRASSTLDGCVKIWTSRVDSVGTETGKLLSNLASEGREVDDEDPTSDNPDSQDPSQSRKRAKTHRAESTLAKNAAQLKSKKLDLEFSVDPLFRKTCEDFDEGGAQGLLMNHLSLGVGSEGALRVIFDASDSMGKTGEEEEDILEPEDEVDLSTLRQDFLPDLDILEDKAISHSLDGFSFSKDPFAFDETTLFRDDTPHPAAADDDDDDDHGFAAGPPADGMDIEGVAPPEEDFFMGDQAVVDDYGGGEGMSPDGYGEDGENGSVGAQAGLGQGPGGFVPFDPRRAPNERDLVMAMTDADADGGMMDYFDQNFLKNWAGPEHWKLRKVVRRPDTTDATAAKPRREKKEAFKIDFSTPAEQDLKERAKELFAPVSRGAPVTLPKVSSNKAAPGARKTAKGKKTKDADKRDEHTLPDDMHFSSRQLVTLFLKPKFSLKMRGQRAQLNTNGDGEVDENFWAQAAADQAAGRAANDADETTNGGAIPFNTQFFHEDYDDGPGFDDGFDGDGGDLAASAEPGEQDLLAATQGQTRRVRPEFVNYTKRAKRVDVRKLKENIWKGLDIVIPEPKSEDVDAMDVDEGAAEGTDPTEPRVFDTVISGLQRSYPQDKLADISTSFCFICLLHLANERGLKLETGDGVEPAADMDAEGGEEERKVGTIWNLKVYRDPDATPAA